MFHWPVRTPYRDSGSAVTFLVVTSLCPAIWRGLRRRGPRPSNHSPAGEGVQHPVLCGQCWPQGFCAFMWAGIVGQSEVPARAVWFYSCRVKRNTTPHTHSYESRLKELVKERVQACEGGLPLGADRQQPQQTFQAYVSRESAARQPGPSAFSCDAALSMAADDWRGGYEGG